VKPTNLSRRESKLVDTFVSAQLYEQKQIVRRNDIRGRTWRCERSIRSRLPLRQRRRRAARLCGSGEGCRKAADQNLALAQFNLGFSYENGDGVAKDKVEAVKWYRKAAEQNFAMAQFSLGFCYANGVGGVKDKVEAVKWYRKAANQNHVLAQYTLGNSFANGEGVAKDAVEAVKWYRKAADQNYDLAQYNLGVCYAKGEGVAADDLESYKWMLLAAAQGQEEAKKSMTIIENFMSPRQIVEAQRLVREFIRHRQ